MIGKAVKTLILLIACVAFVSCSESDRGVLKGRAFDTLTDKAFNSATDTSSSKSSNKGSSGSSIEGKGAKSKGKYSGRETGDEHYIDDDVIFVSESPFNGSGYMLISPSKVITAPSSDTKNEGQYMIIESGKEIWTKNSWKTRIASESELKVGVIVIFFDRREDGVCQPPEDKEQAQRDNGWYMAKITDLSNKYRGYITLSGGWKVAMEDFRIIVKK